MKVIFKRPAETVGHIEDIPNTLEALQRLVDGNIEIVRLDRNNVAIVNEDGLWQKLPYNCSLYVTRGESKVFTTVLVGNIGVAGLDGENFTDVKMSLEEWRNCFGWQK